MKDRNEDMQTIFNELSEKNKDIVLLVAKSMKIAQEDGGQFFKTQNQSAGDQNIV